MARLVLLLLGTLSLGGFVTGEERKLSTLADQLCGTWTRTQQQADGSTIFLMKIITPTHFAVFQQDSVNPRNTAFQAHAGRYTLNDDALTEIYEFSSTPAAIGKTGQSRMTLQDGVLRQIWTHPNGSTSTEEWKRIPKDPAQSR
jgi:hypothetical protein